MKPFVINRLGRLVFPSNFFPELDFTVFETLEQFAAAFELVGSQQIRPAAHKQPGRLSDLDGLPHAVEHRSLGRGAHLVGHVAGQLHHVLLGVGRIDHEGRVEQIQVKQPNAASEWVWGAFKLSGPQFIALHRLWLERGRSDEYFGTLVNAYLANGGRAYGIKRGDVYVDVGTLHGYREAVRVLSNQAALHEISG